MDNGLSEFGTKARTGWIKHRQPGMPTLPQTIRNSISRSNDSGGSSSKLRNGSMSPSFASFDSIINFKESLVNEDIIEFDENERPMNEFTKNCDGVKNLEDFFVENSADPGEDFNHVDEDHVSKVEKAIEADDYDPWSNSCSPESLSSTLKERTYLNPYQPINGIDIPKSTECVPRPRQLRRMSCTTEVQETDMSRFKPTFTLTQDSPSGDQMVSNELESNLEPNSPEHLSSTLKDMDYMAVYQPIQRIDVPQYQEKAFKPQLKNSRRYSSPTGPPSMKSPSKPIIPIPQVVITDHDENDENQKKRLFKRSLSTPEALTPYTAQLIQDSSMYPIFSSGLSMASIASSDGTYVTLDDVAPFKFRGRRKISTGSSIFSAGDERLYLSEDAWSYTNCSSDTRSVRTDTDAGSDTEERKLTSDLQMTGGGDINDLNKDVATMMLLKSQDVVQDAPTNGDVNDKTETVQSKCIDDDISQNGIIKDDLSKENQPTIKREKSARWKKLSRMVKWTPFIQTYRKRKYPWVQLAGHSGSFIRGSQGTVLKKCGNQEEQCYRLLMQDHLSEVVPRYHRNVVKEGRTYLEIDCCLSEFTNPSIMDIKMGVRTFLVGETSVSKPRCDLYEKMISEDPSAPTEAEQTEQAITKYRYLDWRDCISSSRELGFRIEATTSKGKSSKDFKSIKTESQVEAIISQFSDNKSTMKMYLERLLLIKSLCSSSNFFSRHEMIGSSLLFIHDGTKASVWMIDFEKSTPVPVDQSILHNVPWEVGTREDGYLIGLNSLITIFQNLIENSPQT